MPRSPRSAGGRSYDHYCAVARALDAVGDRWSLLVVRELLAGPRRYTDLHADLPGVSTDMLAARLRDLERDGIVARIRLAPPASGFAYQVTPRGQELLPVVKALAGFGRADLAERRATDAVRAHWLAIPLLAVFEDAGVAGLTLDLRTDEGEVHLRPGASDRPYGDGPAQPAADVVLELTAATCVALSRGEVALGPAIGDGLVAVRGPAAADFRDLLGAAEQFRLVAP
jgi:DNA-binding HxlR family transcriptional regulator